MSSLSLSSPSSPRQFSCAKSDASSCPSTPTPTSTTSTSSRAKEEAYYALMAETANLHAEVEALREQLDHQHEQQQQQSQKQHKQWIAENLEEAQQIIDRIVGIKGITEDPLNAAIKMGISHHHHHHQPQPRVSISSSIVPSSHDDDDDDVPYEY
jgi:hypothetical protein